jgi:hypothetical protein
MKYSIIFLSLLFFTFLQTCDTVETDNGQLQIVPGDDSLQIIPGDDSLIPDSIKALLKEDAARLTLRNVHSDSSKKANLIILPEETVEAYYHGLVHIYNADSILARDSVIELYKIHSFRLPEPHSLIVSIDSTKDWVSEWRNGHRLTGNQQVDNLMETYQLELHRYYYWPWAHAAVLYSENAINVFALGKQFDPIDGVFHAEPNGVLGDGDDIECSVEQDHLVYEFSKGWGDCPAGCTNRHYWLFQVDFDGIVHFIKSYGDPLP